MKAKELYGRESYILESDATSAKITKIGAHVMEPDKGLVRPCHGFGGRRKWNESENNESSYSIWSL